MDLDGETIRELAAIGRKCDATNRAGNPCGNYSIPGGNVCRMHGGAAPQVQAKAASRLALVRDLALERLYTVMSSDSEKMDARVLLDTVVKLGAQVELLEGRATSRSDTLAQQQADEVRAKLGGMIDDLAARRAAAG